MPEVQNFNPRSRVGNDRHPAVKLSSMKIFQSTFPRGERLHVGRQTATEVDFNPRSRVGNDEMLGKLYRRIPRFQSTFPRGERPCCRSGTDLSLNFNPRSRVGNDSKFSQIFFAFLCNKYNFFTFYYPFSPFFGVIRFTFLIFVVRILPIFYVYF